METLWREGGRTRGGPDEGTMRGAEIQALPLLPTLLPRKRGICSPWEGWRDGGRRGRRDEENRRTAEREGGGLWREDGG